MAPYKACFLVVMVLFAVLVVATADSTTQTDSNSVKDGGQPGGNKYPPCKYGCCEFYKSGKCKKCCKNDSETEPEEEINYCS